MKQILQNLKSGNMLLEDVPIPSLKAGHLLIQTKTTLISAGTERMLVDFSRASYFEKARQQPDKVKQVINKIKTDGLLPTLETVNAKLDQAIPLGYCNVGKVIAVGNGVDGYKVGDRVVSSGRHAEVVCCPVNLCAHIPDDVSDDQAAFTVISSIGLQGVRLLQPTIGETIAVFGLGLIGLLTCQILVANGVRVIGFDFDKGRVKLAENYGITAVDLSSGADPVQAGLSFSGQQGVDGVLITAATKSHDLIRQSAEVCRKRGRIILTGVTGLNLNRADFYEKELSFQVSCSYGPGRYDPFYEDQGNDYPIGFVRWTEQRNFEAILGLFQRGSLNVEALISKRFPFDKAPKAYDLINDKSIIGLLLDYSRDEENSDLDVSQRVITVNSAPEKESEVVVGVIGAGNFTQIRLLPALAKSSATLKWIASSQGITSSHAAKKFGFHKNTTDYTNILKDDSVNTVFITTQHGSHAKFVIESLQAGKNVFVEKPLCLNKADLDEIADIYHKSCEKFGKKLHLNVGFNRRFAPLSAIMKEILSSRQGPLSLSFMCNAGFIPADHWTQGSETGGGRIIGEAVHFIDYLQFLVGCRIVRASAFSSNNPKNRDMEDNVSIILHFEDGSVGNINYFSNGAKSYPKENMIAFFDGKVLELDNFKKLTGSGTQNFKKKKLMSQDKGHQQGFVDFVNTVRDGLEASIPLENIFNTHEVAFAILKSLRTNETIVI